ncbi:LamB/YcsF family protein [bacterium]|nr:LamB/YcsF family protein [bacterium]
MFDFNCNVAQSWGVYTKNETEYETALWASTINIASGLHAGDPVAISNALKFALEHNPAISALIGYPDIQGFGRRKINLNDDELFSVVIYQIGALSTFASSYNLEIENVRCHGALKDELNSNEHSAEIIAKAIKKINPWLNLIVQNQNTKSLIQSFNLKSALEVEFTSESTISEIEETERQAGFKIDTIHFTNISDIKRAYKELKPTPINYNRVEAQI